MTAAAMLGSALNNPAIREAAKTYGLQAAKALVGATARAVQRRRAAKASKGPRSIRASSTLAPVRQGKTVRVNTVTHTTFKRAEAALDIVQQNASGSPQCNYIQLCPNKTNFPTLATEAAKWTQYCFTKVILEFNPTLSTQTNGSFMVAPCASWDSASQVRAADNQAMQQLPKFQQNPLWSDGSRKIMTFTAADFYKFTGAQNRFQVQESDNYSNTEIGQVQGWIPYMVWGYNGAGTYTDIVGQLVISYEVEFWGPRESADGAASTQRCISAASGLAATVTALNADRWGAIPHVTWSENPTGTLIMTFNARGSFFIAQFLTGATLTVGAPTTSGYASVVRCHNVSTATNHFATYLVTARPGSSVVIAITNHANITAADIIVTSARRNAVAWHSTI